MAGLSGTGPLYIGRDRGLTCQPPGETSRVSLLFTVFKSFGKSQEEDFPLFLKETQFYFRKHQFSDITI